jgi:glycerophosphoryl diester phosphodiesterase
MTIPSILAQHSRRDFLAALGLTPLLAMQTRTANDAVRLIAHRGGVVDDQHPENSPSSIEAAIERGYWMIEVDVRRSKDGQALLQHDANFGRFYGVPRRVDEMTWDEIAQLKATPGGNRPMTFEEVCARCAGRIRLMLDIKGEAFPVEFYQGMIDTLRKHKMLESTFCLSATRVYELTNGVTLRAGNRKEIEESITAGPVVARTRYFFGNEEFNEDTLAMCRKHDILAVAALNTSRYVRMKVDQLEGARADVQRLLALGVRHFQIDSVFDRLLR